MSKKILVVLGTRPEAIKLAPLIYEFWQHPETFETKICVTSQHREMLEQALEFFKIRPDYDLNLMKPNQTLFDITADGLKGMAKILETENPDGLIVQGDTTTAFLAALAGFYKQKKVIHIEAGLRTYQKYSPFPEEMNRMLISRLTDLHFAPTVAAAQNLTDEGITSNVWTVGNTVIDALFLGLSIIRQQGEQKYYEFFSQIDFSKKTILVTGHRRENFGESLRNICMAIDEIVHMYPDVEVVYPVHLNPNVRGPVFDLLGNKERIHLLEPLSYPYLIWLMEKCYMILTDSGGIQEEAPSLNKPVLVLRDYTERTEGIEAGTAKLVGTGTRAIIEEASLLLRSTSSYETMVNKANPFGDGHSCRRIYEIVEQYI